jgi:Ca2+-binding RTX toxin-like protein
MSHLVARRPRHGWALLLAAIALTAVPATARAASVFGSSGFVFYQAAPGEQNDVTVGQSGGTLTITDAGVATISDGSPTDDCTVTGNTATCANASFVSMMLGDLDDTADMGSLPSSMEDTIDGGAGDDELTGSPGQDSIGGGDGNDTISAGAGEDFLGGGNGDDVLNAEAGADFLIGDSTGTSASPGSDVLNGGDGDDFLGADPGPDALNGGSGFDTVSYIPPHTPAVTVTIDGVANDGNATDGAPGARDNVQTTIEAVQGSATEDTLIGSASGNELQGGYGDDSIDGSGGGDLIEGGPGDDNLTGGAGQDALSGERGDDTLNSADGVPDVDQCSIGTDTVNGDALDLVFGDCEQVSGATIGGPPGPPGPTGAPGPQGPPGVLVLVAYQARVSARRVTVSYALTGPANVRLSVTPPHGRTITVARARGRAGINRISWNRRLNGRRAGRGTYRLTLSSTQNGRSASSHLIVRLR